MRWSEVELSGVGRSEVGWSGAGWDGVILADTTRIASLYDTFLSFYLYISV